MGQQLIRPHRRGAATLATDPDREQIRGRSVDTQVRVRFKGKRIATPSNRLFLLLLRHRTVSTCVEYVPFALHWLSFIDWQRQRDVKYPKSILTFYGTVNIKHDHQLRSKHQTKNTVSL